MCLWQSLYRKGTSQTRSVVFLGYHSVGLEVLNSGSPAMSAPSTAARRSLPSKSSCQRSLRDSNRIRSNWDWLRIRKVILDKEAKFLDGIILIGMNRHRSINICVSIRIKTRHHRFHRYHYDYRHWHCDTERFAAFSPNVKTFAPAPLPNSSEVMAECSIAITPDSLRSWSLEAWDTHRWNPWNHRMSRTLDPGHETECLQQFFQSQILRSLSKHNQTHPNLPSQGKYTKHKHSSRG